MPNKHVPVEVREALETVENFLVESKKNEAKQRFNAWAPWRSNYHRDSAKEVKGQIASFLVT